MELALLWSLIVLSLFVAVVEGELTPSVMTTAGPVVGEVATYDGTTVHRYLGIPYAAPPLGELRFSPPQPPRPWNQTRVTARYGNRCMAYKGTDDYFYSPPRRPPPRDEDCLYINVFVPLRRTAHIAQQGRLSVIVYIHAGSLMYGSGSDAPPEALAMIGDVIIVTFNYRVGIFGFLTTTDDSVPGNAGMLDQVLALKWVNENIKSFGGDPRSVTLYGISAGSWSVSAHLVSPLSGGLFQRAICQSGSLYGVRLDTRQERAEFTKTLAQRLDCPADGARRSLECLRAKTSEEIREKAVFDFGGYYLYMITTGDEFLPVSVRELYDSHQVHSGIQVIAGITSEEGSEGLDFDKQIASFDQGIQCYSEEYYKFLEAAAQYSSNPTDSCRRLKVKEAMIQEYGLSKDYLCNNYDKFATYRHLLNLVADAAFKAPTIGMIDKIRENGNKVYLYKFDQRPNITRIGNFDMMNTLAPPELDYGVGHGFDIFYTFGWSLFSDIPVSLINTMTSKGSEISRSIVYSWTHFAKYGKAKFQTFNGVIKDWPEYDLTEKQYLLWKYPMMDPYSTNYFDPCSWECEFFNEKVPALMQEECGGYSSAYTIGMNFITISLSLCLTSLSYLP